MANLSNVTYTGDGATVSYVVPFNYIDVSDISVTIDDVATTAYTWSDASTIEFNVAPSAAAVIYISRDSDINNQVAAFSDGAYLTQEALNDNADQSFYLQQETRDLINTINADNASVLGRVVQNETDIATNVSDIADRVEGAASSTDNAVPKFDGVTGKIVQNTGIIIDDSNNITGVANLNATGHVEIDNAGTDDSVTVNRGGSGDAIVITKSGSGRDIVVNTNEFIVDDGDVTVSGAVSVGGNISVTGTVDGRDVGADGTKLDTIEASADVTDATNVAAAGAVMESDTSTVDMSFVVDEDDMASDSATKVPTQQSVKAYADTKALASSVSNVDNTSDADKPVSTATQTALDLKLDQTSDVELTMQEIATPATPSAGYKSIYPKTDGKLYSLDDAGNEVEIGAGGGSGGINYMVDDNQGADTSVGDWVTYADAAGENPVDGTAGSATTTYTRNTTTPLRGDADFKLVKDAANRQGEGASCAFTIDAADKAQKLTCSFDYDASHAGYADDDIRLSVYDVTNSQLIRVNGEDLKAGKGKHYFQFQTASDSVSYRLIVHVSSTNTAAYDVYFDNFELGPREVARGAIVTEWKDYTPTTQGLGAATFPLAQWRRIGDTLEVNIKGETGTTTASELQIGLPSGLTIATNVNSSVLYVVGDLQRATATDSEYSVLATPLDSFFNVGVRSAVDSLYLTAQNGNDILASANEFTLYAKVKIQGWSSNSAMSEDLGGREVFVSGAGNGNTALTAYTTDIDFTEVTDTTSSWSGSQFTAPESAYYSVTGSTRFAANNLRSIISYVDGASKNFLSYTPTTYGFNTFNDLVYLNKGEAYSIRNSVTESLSSDVQQHWIKIKKLASPQTILETETVAARYTDGSGQTVNNTQSKYTWDSKVTDTHNAMVDGVYTVPASGVYNIQATVNCIGAYASNQFVYMMLQINGSNAQRQIIYGNGSSISLNPTLSTLLSLNAGDTVEIDMYSQLSINTAAGVSGNERNTFSIARIK